MVLGWIIRLLYPFYEKQLNEKKNMVMGYPPPQFHFYETNAFQSFKLGSYLLKAYHLQWLMPSAKLSYD